MPIGQKWVPLAQLMLKGTLVPFLGAGASSFHADSASNEAAGRGPPTGRKLLDLLALEAELEIQCGQCEQCVRPTHSLAQVASYYARVEHTRRSLDGRIENLIGDFTFRPNPLHRLLARVARQRTMLVITTNYDTLLETAFDDAGAAYEVVATAADLLAYNGLEKDARDPLAPSDGIEAGAIYRRFSGSNQFVAVEPASISADLNERSLIYKVHGSVPSEAGWRGGYLIAEEDYVRFLGRMDEPHICPFSIRNRLRKKVPLPGGEKALVHSLLFLGYDLGDWNLRVLLDGLGVGRGGPDERHYAILRNPDRVVERLFGKRNIAVRNADLNDMVHELEETLTSLGLPEAFLPVAAH